MKTIFVPSQRTRSPSHNCQSCNKSLCGTNEYGIGNETKLIGMLCQLDSIHPPFHTRPFICEVVRGCLSLSYTHTHTHRHTFSLTGHLIRTLTHKQAYSHNLHVNVVWGVMYVLKAFTLIPAVNNYIVFYLSRRTLNRLLPFLLTWEHTVVDFALSEWLRALAWHSTAAPSTPACVTSLRTQPSLFKRRIIIARRHSKRWYRRF